jgi:predicted Rossmann-fold nucleotide-binding protein
MSPDTHPVLGVFASDVGPGDAERATLMSQTGSFLARKGARLVCLAEDGVVPVPLVTSARTAGGEVTVIADAAYAEPPAFAGVTVEHLPDAADRLARLAALAQIYVVLPGSLASATSLYRTWVKGGGGAGRKPVVFFDRNGAFKVLRGYAGDVLSNSLKSQDRHLQFADSVEDIWNKIAWLIDQGATAL